MMPVDFEIHDFEDGSKLIRDNKRSSEGTCFNCHKRLYCAWFYMTKVVLDEFTLLTTCGDCAVKILDWTKNCNKITAPVEKSKPDESSPRLVDLK